MSLGPGSLVVRRMAGGDHPCQTRKKAFSTNNWAITIACDRGLLLCSEEIIKSRKSLQNRWASHYEVMVGLGHDALQMSVRRVEWWLWVKKFVWRRWWFHISLDLPINGKKLKQKSSWTSISCFEGYFVTFSLQLINLILNANNLFPPLWLRQLLKGNP